METYDLVHKTEKEETIISEPADQYIDRLDKNLQENENQYQENKSGGKDGNTFLYLDNSVQLYLFVEAKSE